MCLKPNTVTKITVRRLEYAGRLVTMSDDRTVKIVFQGKPDGRRDAGRRKLRWLDCIQNCLKSTDEDERRQIYMGYHSEAGNDYTVRTVRQRRRMKSSYEMPVTFAQF